MKFLFSVVRLTRSWQRDDHLQTWQGATRVCSEPEPPVLCKGEISQETRLHHLQRRGCHAVEGVRIIFKHELPGINFYCLWTLMDCCAAWSVSVHWSYAAMGYVSTGMDDHRVPTPLKILEKNYFIFKALKVLEFGQNWIKSLKSPWICCGTTSASALSSFMAMADSAKQVWSSLNKVYVKILLDLLTSIVVMSL